MGGGAPAWLLAAALALGVVLVLGAFAPAGAAGRSPAPAAATQSLPGGGSAATARPLPPLTILLLGVDARPGEAIDAGVRPDALALLRLDPATGACRLLAVPRDTRAELPGYGQSKVNHALAVGGLAYQREVVEGLLGVAVDRVLLVDLAAVAAIVDAVGGVAVEVPEAFVAADGTPFAAGPQRLDGERALAYVRYRGGADGDFGRIARQQQVLRGLLAELPALDPAPVAARLLPALGGHLRTDLTPAEAVALANRFRASCTPETLTAATLAGTVATFDDPLVGRPLSFVVVDAAEIAAQRARLLGEA